MSEATTSDEPKDDDIPSSAEADVDVPADAPETVEDALEDDEVEVAEDAATITQDATPEAADSDQLGASFAVQAEGGGSTSSGTGGLRGWMSSESGRKIMPIASGAFVIIGTLLILTSLFSGGSAPSSPRAPGPAPTGQLTKAMAVAKGYLIQGKPHTYRRFSAVEAEAADPTLVWNIEKEAVEGEISIRVSGETGIVLATKDASGTVYCIADENAEEEVSKGTVDAAKPEQCKGGW